MSKIARYQGNVRAFASNAQGMERTVFGGTNQADDLTSQITASFLRGWGIVGASEHPSLEDFNAAMYSMSQFIAYQHQMGVPEWHAEQEYHLGSICTHNGESYQSLQNANVGSQPPSAKWTPVLTSKNGLANLGLGDGSGRLIGVRVITSSGTYTPTPGTKSVVVEVQGGGGSGGAAGTPGSGSIAMGGGGAAGAYARSRLTAGFSGVQITIGAGGKGKKPNYSGMDGGVSSFGTITAAGGTGGPAVGAAPPFIITAVGGATASGGSIVSVTGASSLTGIALSESYLSSGPGGSSPLGSGGGPRSTAIAGDNASGFGSGGSGALNLHGASSDLLGGNGSDGVVIVWEYA